MPIWALIVWLIIGGLAGYLAQRIMGGQSPGGLLGDLVLGILGAIVGGYGLSLLGIAGNGGLVVTFGQGAGSEVSVTLQRGGAKVVLNGNPQVRIKRQDVIGERIDLSLTHAEAKTGTVFLMIGNLAGATETDLAATLRQGKIASFLALPNNGQLDIDLLIRAALKGPWNARQIGLVQMTIDKAGQVRNVPNLVYNIREIIFLDEIVNRHIRHRLTGDQIMHCRIFLPQFLKRFKYGGDLLFPRDHAVACKQD